VKNLFFLSLILTCSMLAPAHAATITYDAMLNMNGLPTLASGHYTLDFQLTDGDGTAGDNTVVVSNFMISQTLIPSLTLIGSATGTLGSSVVLTDNPIGDANQGFSHTAGSGTISFRFSYTTNPNTSGFPDEFSFSVLDNNLNSIVTNPASNGGLIQLDINSATAVPQVFAADQRFGSIDPAISRVVGTGAVPEPGSWPLVAGALAVGFVKRSQRVNSVKSLAGVSPSAR
jgi:hypothetical protein